MDMVGEMVIAQSLIRHNPSLSAMQDSRLQRDLSQLARITGEVQRDSAPFPRRLPTGCSQKRRLVIAAAGGAQMMDGQGVFNIGKRNCMALRKILWKAGVMVHAEDLGGLASPDGASGGGQRQDVAVGSRRAGTGSGGCRLASRKGFLNGL